MGQLLKFPPKTGFLYSDALFWKGPEAYERETSIVIDTLLDGADTFLDVGSNIGIYSVFAKLKYPQITVHAFEPIPDIFRKNIAFHRANGLDVTLAHNIGCGDTNTTQQIYLPCPENALEEEQTATLRPDSWQASSNEMRLIDIECVSIDQFMEGYKKQIGCCFMKIDVEDFEAAVLRGASEFITKNSPFILCEILPREHGNVETVALVRKLGYRSFAVTREGLFEIKGDDFNRPRSIKDFLLIPADKLDAGIHYIAFSEIKQIR
ncbi:FkbM family methyltransferase [Rubritalea profundi]|uniref:FkbM family methyltransferase n=1 Tax=Rubritalea profundi TaxID=1658618 RepID=UPI00197F4A7E|nr:FkbM family methyltransferase [Rubritalea profundi]